MLKDKKSNGKQIGFVLLKKIGETKKSKNSDFFYIEPVKVKKFLLKVFKHDDLLYKNQWKNLTINKL